MICHTLADMASKVTPIWPDKFYVGEWLAARGNTDEELAEATGVTPTTVWRWANHQRRPRLDKQRLIEAFFKLEPGGINRPPSDASQSVLLAGLSENRKQDVLDFIAMMRQKEK